MKSWTNSQLKLLRVQCLLPTFKYDVKIKLGGFKRIWGTIRWTHKSKALKATQQKFYRIMAVPTSMYNSENW
jgi:hypothetical protein